MDTFKEKLHPFTNSKTRSTSEDLLTFQYLSSASTPKTACPQITFNDFTSDSEVDSVANESILIPLIPRFQNLSASSLPKPKQNPFTQMLFQQVSSNNQQKCLELLDKSGPLFPKVNSLNQQGLSCLHIASQNGYLRICQMLLDYGKNTEIDIRSAFLDTPLHLACKANQFQVVQFLIRSGSDINALDFQNNTPAHILAAQGQIGSLKWLLSKDPDITLKNHLGLTSASLAANQQTRQVFIQHVQNLEISPFLQQETQQANFPNLKDFVPIGLIGKGSFGEVFLVEKNQEFYALKVLLKERIFKQNLIRYAMTERNVLRYISSPFIVKLLYAFQTSKKLFLIMEYCPRGDLGSLLKLQRTFSQCLAKRYICQVILAIQQLHTRDIIFRDLKPQNIVLDDSGHIKLTDFGLSKQGISDDVQTKSFCGSYAYLAPEVITKKGHSKAVDWYLLGVLFYQMLTGLPPYFSHNKQELFKKIQTDRLRFPIKMSLEAKDLLKNLLERNSKIRLGSRGGAAEIKLHPFFAEVDWERVAARQYSMPKPIKRPIRSQKVNSEGIYGPLNELESQENKVLGWTFISM